MIKKLTRKWSSNFSLLKSARPNIHRQGSFLTKSYSGPQDRGQETFLQVSNMRVLCLASKHGKIWPVGGLIYLVNRGLIRPFRPIMTLLGHSQLATQEPIPTYGIRTTLQSFDLPMKLGSHFPVQKLNKNSLKNTKNRTCFRMRPSDRRLDLFFKN